MEQKFFLKEIEKRLADMEADLAGIREILNQMIQAEETDDKPEIEAVPETAEAPEAPTVEDTPEVVVEPKAEPVSEDVREAVDVPERVKSEVKHAQKVDGRLIADLKRAIGLNDSIRFCRELFGGDKSLMDSTITYLNDASSYMEALEYLAENFSWDEENETVKYFKDILSRKAYS
ncbi:MAG: hypothetical protein IIT93_02155 [Paludibacteraceae bacterium]|nr:hypothetical protein [Paludibacteraceae bacterium]MBQ1753066.1 hypothetical protein [Paludibacteraceae bacterium]MBQ2064611.1 hypothetical protein [Paludibacteraceae bacterium]MBQ4033374.1 hypothetical protein [Paludibacteraceae bacterium]MBQ5524302.1 hypothetical protein [Paludibacteraceae bacterium]